MDPYLLETLWPSLLGIAGMSVAMVWGYFKIRQLMSEDGKK